MSREKKKDIFSVMANYLFAFYFFPFLLIFLLVFFFFSPSAVRLLSFGFISFVIILAAYFYFRSRIYSWFLSPFLAISRAVNDFFNTQSVREPISLKGPPEIRKLISEINRLMLELQAYHGFQISKIVDENNKARALVDIVPDAAILADEKKELIYFNERAKILLKLNPVRSSRLPDCVEEERFYSSVAGLVNTEKDSEVSEFRADFAKKGVRTYFMISKKFDLPSLKKKGVALIIRDITREKEFEAAKDDFFHMVTHDMRAPLSTIEGYCEMLKRKVSVNEETEKYFQKIFYSSKKLKGMIEDILNYRKLKEKKAVLSLSRTDPCELIRRVIDEHMPMAAARNINISSSCAAVQQEITADSALLERAVSNLAGNSIKFTPSGGHIVLNFSQDENFWIFSVKDDGPGIPDDKKNLIFEKYVSYDDEKSRGFGLGLALCRLVAEIHGGEIRVKSEYGKGSEFFISVSKKMSGGTK